MPEDFLAKIAREKADDIKAKEGFYLNLKRNLKANNLTRYGVFKRAISNPARINLIAEIKKASPSAGLIREDFDVRRIAKTYVDHQAAAISVLTEEKYFLGKGAYLKTVADEFQVPVLMKDFIIHEYQIMEGVYNGATAVLLIMAMLEDAKVKDLMAVAHSFGLDCLVEVHDEAEIDRALKCGAEIIGVNNRDLKTLIVDVTRCVRMIPCIPKDKVIVAESGLQSADDIKRVKEAGAHAVLIGETFMRSADIGSKIRDVMKY